MELNRAGDSQSSILYSRDLEVSAYSWPIARTLPKSRLQNREIDAGNIA
jgi:hypothetical protein